MSTINSGFGRGKSFWVLVFTLVAAVAAAVFLLRPAPKTDSLNVPLGVEQAAIITYSGPALAVAPYKWGAAVNVRMAGITEQAGARIYDVRYIVNRGGTFDLKNYLMAADGTALEGLPSFQFHGDPKLSKELEARIQETEEVRVEIGGHYYLTLALLGGIWLIWLLLLIFWKRPKRTVDVAPAAPEPTLLEQLRAALGQLESGALDATSKAKLEMLLLRHWREELAVTGLPMSAALAAIDRSEKTGAQLRQIQEWIHHRASPVKGEEIVAALAPFVAERQPAGLEVGS
jgi:hypothetical protein